MELVMWLGWSAQPLGVHLAGLLMHCLQEYETQGLYAFHLYVSQNKRMHPNILPISFSVPAAGIYSAPTPLKQSLSFFDLLSTIKNKLTLPHSLTTLTFLFRTKREREREQEQEQEQQQMLSVTTTTTHHPPSPLKIFTLKESRLKEP